MGSPRNLNRFRPSPATVVACIALVAACTGTATAATLITGRQIKNNSVTTKDVKNNSLRGGDVRDGSLRAGDFRPGELPRGSAGATGPTGPQGTRGAQGAPGLSELETVTTTTATDSDSPKAIAVTCPAGKKVVNTSYDIVGGKTGPAPGAVTDVVVDNVESFGNQAYLDAYEEDATGAAWSVTLSALCARVAP